MNHNTLRKLLAIMPKELRGPWKFDASNVGQGGWTSEYGITNPDGGSLGIGVDCYNSFRQTWRSDQHMDKSKLGNVMAAYVAAASPATVEDLIAENDRLRALVSDMLNSSHTHGDFATDATARACPRCQAEEKLREEIRR